MSITQFYLTVTGETAKFTGTENLTLTAGSAGVYEAVFATDAQWDGLALEAVFVSAPASWPTNQNATVIRRSVPLTGGVASVPEALFTKAGYLLYAGLCGMAEGIEKNSTLTPVRYIQPGADADGPGTEDIPESRYQQLLTQIEALKAGGTSPVTATVEPTISDIPKVFLTGTLPTTKDACTMGFRYISQTTDFQGFCEIKCQGNSSMSYPKKNFTIKMYQDESLETKMKQNFKGWGKQNKHVYKANWIDLSHARNVVSARLWADVVKSRADYNSLPELLRTSPNQGAVDGFPVKLYSGGVYQGRYTLNIPKDKWTFNMDDDLEQHCALCSENYVSGCFRAAANINESDWTDEIHDTVPDSIKTRWNEVIAFVMNATDDEFTAGLSDYFYVDSLIDYHLFGLLSCGLDAYGKNQIYLTYDGQKWIASMYDMDSTWGLYWNGSKFVASDYGREEYEDFVNTTGNLLYVRLESLFYGELQNRWEELKNGVLSVDNIINHFERFTDIAPADLVAEDYASTTAEGRFTGIPSKSTNNIQQIRDFVIARHLWMDDYMAGSTGSEAVACTGVTLSHTTLDLTVAETQTLTAQVTPENCTDPVYWESDNTDSVLVADGVVTAVSEGTANITATCGSFSALCQVQVSTSQIEYTVTRNLTNCSSDTTTTSITSGSTYCETLCGNTGYTMTGATVSVTMGETDITDHFSAGVLTIEDVTGDIVITAQAVAASTLYQLPQVLTLDGTSYYNTEYQLMAVDQDFTFFLAFTGAEENTSRDAVLHCMTEASPYPGINITIQNTSKKYRVAISSGQNIWEIPSTDTSKVRIAISHAAGTDMYTWHLLYNDALTSGTLSYSDQITENPVILGAVMGISGNFNYYWTGTIHGFSIVGNAYTDQEIKTCLLQGTYDIGETNS